MYIHYCNSVDGWPGRRRGVMEKCGEKGVYKITVYRNTFSEEIKRRQEKVAAGDKIFSHLQQN